MKGNIFVIALTLVLAALPVSPVVGADYDTVKAKLEKAMAGETRTTADTDRDRNRMPIETLEFFGYKVLVANSGSAAIKIINQTNYPIELLITDVVMPGMNGQELAETVRSKQADIKIIFMSGYTEHILEQDLISSDLKQAFLRKPISIDMLIHKVREVLDF